MYNSRTYGKVELSEIPKYLNEYYNKQKHFDSTFKIVVGTDSQNFSDTKMVTVIAIVCEGHGGIFFYEITRQNKITDIRRKLHIETNLSLNVAEKLVEMLEDKQYEDLFLHSLFQIHIDAGSSNYGKTKELIPELVGWIKSCGYDCEVKPDSYVASTIADKLSK